MDPLGHMKEEDLNQLLLFLVNDDRERVPADHRLDEEPLKSLKSCGQCKYFQHITSGDHMDCLYKMLPITPLHGSDEGWNLIIEHSELCELFKLDDQRNNAHEYKHSLAFTPERYEALEARIARAALAGVVSPKFKIRDSWRKAYDNHVRHLQDVGSEVDSVHPND